MLAGRSIESAVPFDQNSVWSPRQNLFFANASCLSMFIDHLRCVKKLCAPNDCSAVAKSGVLNTPRSRGEDICLADSQVNKLPDQLLLQPGLDPAIFQ
jgi:hypothetical protein